MLYSGPAQNRMMRLVWVAATFCILGWLAAYADAGVVDVRVQSSRTETVQVHTPNGYNGEPIPLIVALHGFTQSGPQVERKWNMEQMGNDLNVAWITPTGASRRWCGAGCCGCSSDRDSKFLRAMVEEVIRNPQVNIDESSIFFMGISNGGFMSYRMACEHADLIAGIMPICGANYWKHAGGGGGGGGFSMGGTCNPSEPVNVLHIHGTRDTVIRSSTAAPSVEGWASFQCKGATEKTDSPYASPPQNHHWGDEISKVEVRRWEGCEQNGDVELWMAPGVAHCPYSGWANAQWLLDRPKGGRSPSAGGGGDASQRKGQYDPDFLWELIVFLQTASDGLDPALTATFIQYLDSIFNAPPPPPPYRPAPAPVPSPSPSYGGSGSSGGFRFGGGSSMGSFLSRYRKGRGTMTMSEFDDSTVFAKNDACVFPFRDDDGVMHLGCVPSDDDDESERCKDASGAWTMCYALDDDIFENEPLGREAIDDVTAEYAVDIDLGALMLADLAYVADGEWSADDDSALKVTLGQFDDSTVAIQYAAPVQVDGSPCSFPVSYQGQTWMECVPIGAEYYCINADNEWGMCRQD